jgi:hypothetical protein
MMIFLLNVLHPHDHQQSEGREVPRLTSSSLFYNIQVISRPRHHDYSGVKVRRGMDSMAKNWIACAYKCRVALALPHQQYAI